MAESLATSRLKHDQIPAENLANSVRARDGVMRTLRLKTSKIALT